MQHKRTLIVGSIVMGLGCFYLVSQAATIHVPGDEPTIQAGIDAAVSGVDEVVVAPYLTQFLAEPRYGPLPQVAVAAAGRVFKAFGHVAFKVREEPLLNKLVAFNGYNGTILWQRDLREGVMIHRNTMIATPTTLTPALSVVARVLVVALLIGAAAVGFAAARRSAA